MCAGTAAPKWQTVAARLVCFHALIMHGPTIFPDVRPERSSLAELPLCEKHGLVWVIPTPAADGSTDFDIDPWLGGLGPELASFEFASWAFYDKRVIPETMNWKILVDTFNEGYHV